MSEREDVTQRWVAINFAGRDARRTLEGFDESKVDEMWAVAGLRELCEGKHTAIALHARGDTAHEHAQRAAWCNPDEDVIVFRVYRSRP